MRVELPLNPRDPGLGLGQVSALFIQLLSKAVDLGLKVRQWLAAGYAFQFYREAFVPVIGRGQLLLELFHAIFSIDLDLTLVL